MNSMNGDVALVMFAELFFGKAGMTVPSTLALCNAYTELGDVGISPTCTLLTLLVKHR